MEKVTSLTIRAHGKEITTTFDHGDLTVDKWFEAFRTGLIGITFFPETIDNYIIELADDLREEQESKDAAWGPEMEKEA